MMAHLFAYDQGFEDGRLLMIYVSIYDHGGGAHGLFLKKTLSCEEVPYVDVPSHLKFKIVKVNGEVSPVKRIKK